MGRKKPRLMPKAHEVTKASGSELCTMCHRSKLEGNELQQAGKFFKFEDHFFHYFCVLFCRKVFQKGRDDEGLLGFLIEDIQIGIDVAKSSTCCFCQMDGAGSSCKKCGVTYHYICGLNNGAAFIYVGTMDSLCREHIPQQRKAKVKIQDRTCLAGCQEIIRKDERSMISPCCGRLYHVSCLQEMALHSGSGHFKCPICSDKQDFTMTAKNLGIYIPVKDAAWEEEEDFYNFQQMARQYQRCDAEQCLSSKGREHNPIGTHFEIIRCEQCGSKGVHIKCGKLIKQAPFYVCNDHESAEDEMTEHKMSAIKRLREENIFLSDEEDGSDIEEDSTQSTAMASSNRFVFSSESSDEYDEPPKSKPLKNQPQRPDQVKAVSVVAPFPVTEQARNILTSTPTVCQQSQLNQSYLNGPPFHSVTMSSFQTVAKSTNSLSASSSQTLATNPNSVQSIQRFEDDDEISIITYQTIPESEIQAPTTNFVQNGFYNQISAHAQLVQITQQSFKSESLPGNGSSSSSTLPMPSVSQPKPTSEPSVIEISSSESESEADLKQERYKKRFWAKSRRERERLEQEKEKLQGDLFEIFSRGPSLAKKGPGTSLRQAVFNQATPTLTNGNSHSSNPSSSGVSSIPPASSFLSLNSVGDKSTFIDKTSHQLPIIGAAFSLSSFTMNSAAADDDEVVILN